MKGAASTAKCPLETGRDRARARELELVAVDDSLPVTFLFLFIRPLKRNIRANAKGTSPFSHYSRTPGDSSRYRFRKAGLTVPLIPARENFQLTRRRLDRLTPDRAFFFHPPPPSPDLIESGLRGERRIKRHENTMLSRGELSGNFVLTRISTFVRGLHRRETSSNLRVARDLSIPHRTKETEAPILFPCK